MEYMESDVNKLLKNNIDFTEKHLVKLVYNILCALSFLHEANVIHRDIKCSNILITPNCDAKISDFGISRSVPLFTMDNKGFNSMYIRKIIK